MSRQTISTDFPVRSVICTLVLLVVWNAVAVAETLCSKDEALMENARKLRQAASECQVLVNSGQLSDCEVEVTFRNNELISIGAARALAADLDQQASGLCKTETMFRARAQKTQQAVVAHQITDCEAMARLFDELGRDVSWNLDALVQTSARVLAGRVGYRDVTLVKPAPEEVVLFGERGFDGKYRDKEPGNQVRHFVGYFAIGAIASGPLLTELIAEWRDGQEPGDYQFGVLAANLGRQMRNNPQLVRGLGGGIRKTICR